MFMTSSIPYGSSNWPFTKLFPSNWFWTGAETRILISVERTDKRTCLVFHSLVLLFLACVISVLSTSHDITLQSNVSLQVTSAQCQATLWPLFPALQAPGCRCCPSRYDERPVQRAVRKFSQVLHQIFHIVYICVYILYYMICCIMFLCCIVFAFLVMTMFQLFRNVCVAPVSTPPDP